MSNNNPDLRLAAVQYYLKHDSSLRTAAKKFKIGYRTLYKWVKWYKEQGNKRLLVNYHRPWNRTKLEIEEFVLRMKEEHPAITIRKTKQVLCKQGLNISIKGIWGIWKRYGLAGFRKEEMTAHFTEYGASTIEATQKLTQAEKLFGMGEVDQVADVLNSIPFIPANDLLVRIPDDLLNERRKLEKTSMLYGKTDINVYLRETETLIGKLIRKRKNLSALRVGVMNVIAATWSTEPERELQRIARLYNLLGKYEGCFSYQLSIPRFLIMISEGIAYASLMEMKKAHAVAKACRSFLRNKRLPSPYFFGYLSTLYIHLEEYREAALLRARLLRDDNDARVTVDFIKAFIRNADYKQAAKLMKKADFKEAWGGISGKLRSQAILSLMNGMPQQAISEALEAVSIAEKKELTFYLFYANFLLACAYCSMGEKEKGHVILNAAIPFLKKHRLTREMALVDVFLTERTRHETRMIKSRKVLSRKKLSLLMKYGKHQQALNFARNKGMLSYFHRYAFFFPKIINIALEKGEATGLPKVLLRLPVFNKDNPVYVLNFLGELVIKRNQKVMKLKLPPKDSAFLIHLALRAGEPGKRILLEDINKNFWPRSTRPTRNLSHLLVRVKRAINLPTHRLEISRKGIVPVLINQGIFLITDYGEFHEMLIRAQAFHRLGEWDLAKRDYIKAFKVVRGLPFKRMYDVWSDNTRISIMNEFESYSKKFKQECANRNEHDIMEEIMRENVL